MIQGINEHVANDLTELFPQLGNKRLLLRQSESIHLCLDGSILCYACIFQPEGRVRRIWPSSVRRSTSRLTIVCLRSVLHGTHQFKKMKDPSGLLPALSSSGGSRRESTTNWGPSLFGPSLTWYTSTSATLVSPILFKLVLSVADGFLRCKCGRDSMDFHKGAHRAETLARRQNSCNKSTVMWSS